MVGTLHVCGLHVYPLIGLLDMNDVQIKSSDAVDSSKWRKVIKRELYIFWCWLARVNLDLNQFVVVLYMQVACRFRKLGCMHVGQLSRLSSHVRDCTYNPDNLPDFLRTDVEKDALQTSHNTSQTGDDDYNAN